MDRGAGAPMDASQNEWDWEVLPDHRRFSIGRGSNNLDETMEPVIMPPSVDPDVQNKTVDECKDIGVVPDETNPSTEESMPNVTDPLASDGEEGEKTFQSSDAKEPNDDKFSEEEEDTKKDSKAPPECVVFSVGKLKVNGIGALCSFGFAAATVCIFLIGGRLQHHHRQPRKIQLQLYGDDKRIQQVVQQTSKLNQAMSSVMGAGTSTRANISFGGFYDGF
ncbi:uncharacterized protein LOC133891009 isoform X2 [Phragmites australis]|uniref:uncharacterized protein LOC133891009 isoform X2 n=1 Tax=Phragmites australis TaxID=29695 RepID=UPI002D7878D7|nr:uncharacterized protein LOC133891009 isoform X2 [Phragmites australis]